ncbi:MAG: endo-1,4-beta-xylanase [Duncaniella sp.]|nr:endo-1,4-beta-xylanase [Duncaniella sp.]
MRKSILNLLPLALVTTACHSEQAAVSLKDHFKDDFLIGAAIPTSQLNGSDAKSDSLVALHFNCIVAENCMKSEKINPAEGVYFWDDADAFVEYGIRNKQTIIGHALVWHSQLAPWFPVDSAGAYVKPEVLKERMKAHISATVGRYKGKIHGWDVVNEAILDDGSYRSTPFYDILGEEYIALAFQYAHEADPDAELYINDFSMANPAKRERYIKIAEELRARGIRIDGIGMQGHMGMDYPPMDQFEKSIEEFGKTGLQVMITEWDMSALPTVHEGADISMTAETKEQYNPYRESLPAEVSEKWNSRMADCLAMFKRHSDVISRVTVWGVHDGMSWRNDFPMHGRTDYPLPFDREYNLKDAFRNEISSNK